MAASSSSQRGGGELILAAPHGRPITAYDALTGDVLAEFPAANTPRHGLAVATGPGGTAFVAASHVCPATGAGSIRLLQWWSPAPARELPVPELVAALVAAPYGTHLLAGGVSGCVHAIALPSGGVASSFRAHGGGAVSCLALSDDGSLLVSGGDDGGVAVFPLIRVLDADDASVASAADNVDHAIYRVAAYVAPVTSVVCGRGGCNAVVASASADGTCKVWRLADGAHLRTLALPCTALSLALDPTSSNLYAGGSEGRVHVASLNSPCTKAVTTATASHSSEGSTNAAALVAVALANGCRNLVSCSEDGEVRVWDLTPGLFLANAFWVSGAVSGALVVRRVPGELARGGGERFRLHDGMAWTRARELADMGQLLRAEEEEMTTSVEPIEMNAGVYRRCLRLLLRETTVVANGGRRDGAKDGSDVSG
ncbi:hypothetical protein SETIT_2G243200v2 [Setaria italica]|uniref:Uncharacterized protein n=1 Tax=Setaria italica TaxID=4555 RepID=K4A114_SETIT|nr:protein ROOT INITIATION DEFECTIVE 3 [Setaria italica]RCV12114.1 hypothetical protein SETIT_2G243200v2 [Setaria italica]